MKVLILSENEVRLICEGLYVLSTKKEAKDCDKIVQRIRDLPVATEAALVGVREMGWMYGG